jgi:short-chain fatty acids transporter
MATDLIQPFWALPLLAVARLEFRDILGPLSIACVAYISLVTAGFLLFA